MCSATSRSYGDKAGGYAQASRRHIKVRVVADACERMDLLRTLRLRTLRVPPWTLRLGKQP
ncbi:MAG TPA: hypothetical protein VK986_09145 [Tepidisphaeraceae bacterium]|nr:hypothetical protein [Tepidisphaeraceae bacterium]